MRAFIDTGKPVSNALPPPQELKVILNEQECRVWSVECTWSGKLFYRNKGSLRKCFDIAEIRFLDSYTDRNYATAFNVHADFDIITLDGRVIEVSTWSRKIIESAVRLIKKPDPREHLRAARRANGN